MSEQEKAGDASPPRASRHLDAPVGPLPDNCEMTDDPCPKCGELMYTQPCGHGCEDGYYHDCGEDCCCCADPYPNVPCSECRGTGNHVWCRNCGWDAVGKEFLNGKDERPNTTHDRTGGKADA